MPCTDKIVENRNYVNALKSTFIGIKSRIGRPPQSMAEFDPQDASVWAPYDVTGQDLINYVKEAKRHGTIANITFHGIGGDHLAVSIKAHQELLAYLVKNNHLYWVDTYRKISLYIQENHR